jgi:hypothetical protein
VLSRARADGHQWLGNFTDSQFADTDLDAYVQQGFTHARAWLGTRVRQLTDGSDEARADELEMQVCALHSYACSRVCR